MLLWLVLLAAVARVLLLLRRVSSLSWASINLLDSLFATGVIDNSDFVFLGEPEEEYFEISTVVKVELVGGTDNNFGPTFAFLAPI